MKRILSILVLASILLCSFAACEGNKITEDFVIGEWEGTDTYFIDNGKTDIDKTLILFENKEATLKKHGVVYNHLVGKYYPVDDEYYGTWKIEDNELVISFTSKRTDGGSVKEVDDRLTLTRDGSCLDDGGLGQEFHKCD